jgi:hypothetical protein
VFLSSGAEKRGTKGSQSVLVRWCKSIAQLNSTTHGPQKLTVLNFSIYQSGVDFKCPYSNRPLKPLTPLIGLWQGLFSGA